MTKKLRLGIILTMCLLLTGTASAYPRAVLFTFDDVRASVYTTGYPIFANHGYNATFYVVTDEINNEYYPGKSSINLTQLRALYNAGWDISDHTKHHEYFVTDSLDLSEQVAEIQGGKNDLDGWGFTRASNHLAFPGGQYDNNTTLAMTSVGMLTGRTVEPFPLTVPPLNNDVFHLTGVRDLDQAYENEQYTYLESLSSDNVVIYQTHGVDDPSAGASSTTSAVLENMLDYMYTHHIPVWTITQLYANISASGPYSPIPFKPAASFTGTPVSGTVPLTVVFTDSSSGTSITNRRWDFGDGNISSYAAATNPTHVYSSAGTYSVNLTVTNASGSNSQLRSNYITVSGGSATFVATTSGSSDGEVDRTNSVAGESFASLRNGAGNSADPTGSYLYVGIRSAGNNNANSYNVLRRNAFLFNTSGLPDNAIVTGATLSVWSGTSSNFKNQLGTTSYGVTGINTLTSGLISQNDYQNLVNTRYSDTDIPQTQIANYNYNNWVFNAAGISAISKTGWTNVTVRTKWDIDNDTTGLTWLPYQNTTQVLLYAAENHVGKEPTLTIRYTIP
jgi:PKD repeat protein